MMVQPYHQKARWRINEASPVGRLTKDQVVWLHLQPYLFPSWYRLESAELSETAEYYEHCFLGYFSVIRRPKHYVISVRMSENI